jgi:hypothetical protein
MPTAVPQVHRALDHVDREDEDQQESGARSQELDLVSSHSGLRYSGLPTHIVISSTCGSRGVTSGPPLAMYTFTSLLMPKAPGR